MASKFRNMFEQNNDSGNDSSPGSKPAPGRLGGGGPGKLKSPFGDQSGANSSTTSQSSSPAGGGNKFGNKFGSSVGGGNNSSSPAGASWGNRNQAKPKKAAPKPAQADLVLSFLKARESRGIVQKERQVQALTLIQAEYRNYLVRTTGSRDMIRRRRAEKLERYKKNLTALIAAARQHGMELCLQEAKERYNLFKKINQSNVYLHQLIEENMRKKILSEEETTFDELQSKEAPKILIPGTLENDEFTSRMHNNKYMMHNFNDLLESFAVQGRLIYLKEESNDRVKGMIEECHERSEVLKQSNYEHWGLQLGATEVEETQYRTLLFEARDRYVSTLTQRRALTLRETLMWGGFGSETTIRAEIIYAELVELRHVWEHFILQTISQIARDLGEQEARRRQGWGGLIAQERNERAAIVRAVIALKLQLLQGDDIDDVDTERGSRTAIEWAEARERFALQGKLAATAFHTLLPGQESSIRRKIMIQEFNIRQRFTFSGEIRDFLLNVREPLMRRDIFKQYVDRARMNLIAHALLKLQASEEIYRKGAWALSEIEMQHMASLEYLVYIEMKERHLLKGMRGRVADRLKAHSDLAAKVARGNAYQDAMIGGQQGSPLSDLMWKKTGALGESSFNYSPSASPAASPSPSRSASYRQPPPAGGSSSSPLGQFSAPRGNSATVSSPTFSTGGTASPSFHAGSPASGGGAQVRKSRNISSTLGRPPPLEQPSPSRSFY